MSLTSDLKALVPQLASTDPSVLASAYWTVSSYFVNSNGQDVKIAKVVLPAILAAAERDPLALVPLATAAHGLFNVQAYADSLRCLEPVIAADGTGPALSRKDPPWQVTAEPFTRERELALEKLFRYECLLGVGRLDDAEASLPGALSAASILPVPFKLYRSILHWGDPEDFVVAARIRATRALRESGRLATARQVVTQVLPALDASLPKYATLVAGGPRDLSIDERRALQDFRGAGYAEAGLLAQLEGDKERAARLLGTAHSIFAIAEPRLGVTIETDYEVAIRALAAKPVLLDSQGRSVA